MLIEFDTWEWHDVKCPCGEAIRFRLKGRSRHNFGLDFEAPDSCPNCGMDFYVGADFIGTDAGWDVEPTFQMTEEQVEAMRRVKAGVRA